MNYSLNSLKIEYSKELSPLLSLYGNVKIHHFAFSHSASPFIITSHSLFTSYSTFTHLRKQIFLSYSEDYTQNVILWCNVFADVSTDARGSAFNVKNIPIKISNCVFSRVISTAFPSCFYAESSNVNITKCTFVQCRCKSGNDQFGNAFYLTYSNNNICFVSTYQCADIAASGDSAIALTYSKSVIYQYSNSSYNSGSSGAGSITILSSTSPENYLKFLNTYDCNDMFVIETYGTITTYIDYCNIINGNKATTRIFNNHRGQSLYVRSCCFINPGSKLCDFGYEISFENCPANDETLTQYFTFQQSVKPNDFEVDIKIKCNYQDNTHTFQCYSNDNIFSKIHLLIYIMIL